MPFTRDHAEQTEQALRAARAELSQQAFLVAALRLGSQWAAHEELMTLNNDERRFLDAYKALNPKGIPSAD